MSNLIYRVLALNHDNNSRKILLRAFREEGFSFDTANSAEAGYQKILKQHYDLIVCDILFKDNLCA